MYLDAGCSPLGAPFDLAFEWCGLRPSASAPAPRRGGLADPCRGSIRERNLHRRATSLAWFLSRL